MYKRKSKPDLMFMMTVFVCLGILLTATVNAAESGNWGINLGVETGCEKAIGEWQGCSQWLNTAKYGESESSPYRAALRLSREERPDLDVTWYYTQAKAAFRADRGDGLASSDAFDRGQFGVVVKQQYRHFGLSMGIEAEHPEALTGDPLLYFGLTNRW